MNLKKNIRHLTPINFPNKKYTYTIETFDFETCVDEKKKLVPYCAATYYEIEQKISTSCLEKKTEILCKYQTFWLHPNKREKLSKDFVKYLIKKTNTTFFAHNLWKFDIYLIFDALNKEIRRQNLVLKIKNKGSEILQLNIAPKPNSLQKNWNIFLCDSKNFFNTSLNEIAKEFLNNKKKLNKNEIVNLKYSYILNAKTKIKKKLLDYTKHDCFLLFKCLTFFNESCKKKFEVSPLLYVTLTAYVYALFKFKFLPKDKRNCIVVPNYGLYEFIKSSYRGGRCEIFRPFASKNLEFLDFKSLYPAVCIYEKLPTGSLHQTFNFLPEKLGIYTCEIEFENKKILPFLPLVIEEHICYPVGQWVGVYTSAEINFARELGYKITVKNGIFFAEADYLFDEFFGILFKWKMDAELQNKQNERFLAKRMLNCLTGRFAIKQEQRGNIKIDSLLNRNLRKDPDFAGFEWEKKLSETSEYILTYSKKKERFSSISKLVAEASPQISTFITAYARIWLYKVLSHPQIIPLYCDTDSILLQKKDSLLNAKNLLNETLIKSFKNKRKGLTDLHFEPLGTLASVIPTHWTLKKVLILAPKSYLLHVVDTASCKEFIKIIWKGIFQNPSLEENLVYSTSVWQNYAKYLLKKNWKLPLILEDYTAIKKSTKFFGLEQIQGVTKKNVTEAIKNENKNQKILKKNVWIKNKPLQVFVSLSHVNWSIVQRKGHVLRWWLKKKKNRPLCDENLAKASDL